jgi:hypothetical protein
MAFQPLGRRLLAAAVQRLKYAKMFTAHPPYALPIQRTAIALEPQDVVPGQTESADWVRMHERRPLSVVIRCKGTSSNFELRSKLNSNGDKVSGSWEERTYNAAGDASGTASAGKLNVQFSGSLTGSLEMSFSSSSQSVSVSVDTKGTGIKGARVSLNRV